MTKHPCRRLARLRRPQERLAELEAASLGGDPAKRPTAAAVAERRHLAEVSRGIPWVARQAVLPGAHGQDHEHST